MEVLAWLDERSFEWDMYVDMPAGAVRYCFRTLADTTAFKLRFVHAAQRRTVGGGNCSGWPQQIVLPARLCERGGYNEIHEFWRSAATTETKAPQFRGRGAFGARTF